MDFKEKTDFEQCEKKIAINYPWRVIKRSDFYSWFCSGQAVATLPGAQ